MSELFRLAGVTMEKSLAAYMTGDIRRDKAIIEQLAFNEKMAELGLLAAGLMHELNTPLSVISSAAQLIQQYEELPESLMELVNRISEEALRLSRFTKGLLSFSRRDDASTCEADINQVLREVMSFLNYEALKRSISVVEDVDFQMPSIPADANHLKQIFINLIMNAMQAMENGGMLLIRGNMLNDKWVEIQIGDTGNGIAPAAMERLFEPFFTTKRAGEGTGLGLFITRKIVEMYGGAITVESHLGQGTTFTVTLPVEAISDACVPEKIASSM
jgi:two-component system NtrC family sensor kinase